MTIKYENNTDREQVLANMVEVEFVDSPEDGFRKVKETLERMGIPKRNEKTLFQSAHILHKKGRYYICHFLELFALDGRAATLEESDVARRNLIVKYLVDWGLVKPLDPAWAENVAPASALKVIKYSDRDDWDLRPKYTIGNRRSAAAA